MKKPVICIVLDNWERGSFLTKELECELGDLGELCWREASEFKTEEEWKTWLVEKKPEIMISGWMTPRLPEDLKERVPELKYICHLVGSVKGMIPDNLIEEGLLVTNWGNSVARTVAECGLMLAIGGLRRASHWAIEMHKRGGWKERTKVETGSLFDRKVGIHGFGAISRELVKLMRPFNVEISTYSPSVPENILEECEVKRSESLADLFSKNDVIIELEALTEKTRGIITEELLRSIPAGGVFVNIGRGAVVDEEALARVAKDGHIQVGLDVYTTEPLPLDSPLRANDNIMMLPHLGGPTIDRRKDATRFGIENIKRYLSGEKLESQITAGVYARIS